MRGDTQRIGITRGLKNTARIGRTGLQMLYHSRNRLSADLRSAGRVEIDARLSIVARSKRRKVLAYPYYRKTAGRLSNGFLGT